MHNYQAYSKELPHSTSANTQLKSTITTTTSASASTTTSTSITVSSHNIISSAVNIHKSKSDLKPSGEVISSYSSSTLNVIPTCITSTSTLHPIIPTSDVNKNELSTFCMKSTPIDVTNIDTTSTSTSGNILDGKTLTANQQINLTSVYDLKQPVTDIKLQSSKNTYLKPNRPSLIRRKGNISELDAFDIPNSIKGITTNLTNTNSSNKSSIIFTRNSSTESNYIIKKINSFEEDNQQILSTIKKIGSAKLLTTCKTNIEGHKIKFGNTYSTSTCTSPQSSTSPLDHNQLIDTFEKPTNSKTKDHKINNNNTNNKMKSKDNEIFNSGSEYKTIVKSASISPSKKNSLKHQISHPMNIHNRSSRKMSSSLYCNSDTSFLSMLAASRPTAAKGLLGVASAALAAARAGTFINNPIGTSTHDSIPKSDTSRSSRSIERNHQIDMCSCQCHCCPYKSHHYDYHRFHDQQPKQATSPSVRLNWLSEQLSIYGYRSRRYSDPTLNVTDDKVDMAYIKLLLYLSQKSYISDENEINKNISQFQHYYPFETLQPTDDIHQTNRKTSLYETRITPMKSDDFFLNELNDRNSAIYSSLMDMNLPDFFLPSYSNVGEIGKCSSTMLLNTDHPYIDSLEKTNSKSRGYYTPNTIQPYTDDLSTIQQQQHHQLYQSNQSKLNLHKHGAKEISSNVPSITKGISCIGVTGSSIVTSSSTSGTHPTKSKRTGLDAIGLDFMLANGARPGLVQLRHVKEFKAAKELENQQQQTSRKDESQETKSKIKHSNIGKYPGPLGIFPSRSSSGGAPAGTNQQSPFHHLISGGVLGATVLTLAAKDGRSTKELKDFQKEQPTSAQLEKITSSLPKEQRIMDENNVPRLCAQQHTDQLSEAFLEEYGSSNQNNKCLIADQVTHNHEELPEPTTRNRPFLSSETSNESKTSQPISDIHAHKNSMYCDKTRYHLARSATVTSSSPMTQHTHYENMLNRNRCDADMIRLQETLSVPGLIRVSTEDSDYTDDYNIYKRQNSFETNDRPPSHDSSNVSLHTHSANIYHEPLWKHYDIINENEFARINHDNFRLRNANAQFLSNQPSLDKNDIKSVQFDNELKNEQRANSVTNHLNSYPSSHLNAGYHSRIKRLRDNFEKSRSSTYTWRPTWNMGGLVESRTDEEQPLTTTRISGSDSRVFHTPGSSVLIADKNSTTTVGTLPQISIEETDDANKSIKISVLAEQERFSPSTFELQTDDEKKHDDMQKTALVTPVVHIESEMEEITDDNERSIIQRRRDAMNNQHQQRTIKNVGYRLGKRKRLFEKRCRISDFSLSFAVFGILVMLIETEFTFAGVYKKDSIYSFITKSCISISTCILLGLILAYHVYVIKIFSCDDSIEDWRMAVDYNRILQMTLEVLVCIIHPFPGSYLIQFPVSSSLVGPGTEIYSPVYHNTQAAKSLTVDNITRPTTKQITNRTTNVKPFSGLPTFSNSITDTTISSYPTLSSLDRMHSHSVKIVSIDLILSVPMFFRLYLLFRVMLLHSKLFTDAGSRSIGAMNKVNFDTRFIFKTLMTMCPGKLLLGFILCLWIVYSWTLRACESFYDTENGSLLNSMWLIAVTFLSIGYGDIVPHTYCGRVIALATGVMGSGCTALVVAVFARKLELSKAEKHVIHFMMENQLNKKVKNYAANVLRETWLIYKYTKLVKRVEASKVRTHQRKFLRAIHGLRRMKLDQRKVQDSANTLVDLAKTQTNIYEIVTDLRMEQSCLQHRMETLESSLTKVQEQLRALPGLIRTAIIQQHIAYQKLVSTPVTTSSVNQPMTLKFEEHKS
ncbi:Small conductance calcium-activated potassium channel protein 2 [Schistosoma japonicum]|nr:Small conductance calcium-activated potassium channel protein 2 [Schistosoma japonicum]